MPSGAGIAATKAPKASGESAQTSASIERPCPSRDAQQAGPARRAAGERVAGGSRASSAPRAGSAPPRPVSSWFSGMPERCAPTTASSISPSRARLDRAGGLGCGAFVAPSGVRGTGMKLGAERSEEGVAAGRRDQRDAGRKTVGAKATGHGERAEVEQVDEVGVGAELGVRPDRIGVEIGERARARIGRHGEARRSRAQVGSQCAPQLARADTSPANASAADFSRAVSDDGAA